jgi:adenosylcobinamide-GDP ribazoletransferase
LLKGFRSLLSLLTSIPLGGGNIEDAARSFYAVPVVGALEGLALSAYLCLLKTLGVAAEVAALTYVVAHIALTGGIHLDGLADYSDVLGSRLRGDEAIAVLKDPRRGAYGVLLTAILITASYALTERAYRVLPSLELVALLIPSYIASTEAMYVASAVGRNEPYQGLAREFTLRAKEPGSISRNAALYLLAVASIAPVGDVQLTRLLAIAFLAPIVGYLVARDANLRLGFVNGDVLGFCFEVCRVLSLLVVAL